MGVRDWDPMPYPDARLDRARTVFGDVGLAVVPPTSRLWSGMTAWGSNTLSTAVSPRYIGPAILRHLTVRAESPLGATEQPHVLLLVSPDSGGQGQVVYGQPRPTGVSIVDTSFQPGAPFVNTAYRDGFFLHATSAPTDVTNVPLQYIVHDVEFYLKICAASPTNLGGRMHFTVSLLERCDPNTLVDLVAGL